MLKTLRIQGRSGRYASDIQGLFKHNITVMAKCTVTFTTLLVLSVQAAEYCAFHIEVEDADGLSKGVSQPITIADLKGNVIAKSITRDGKADICDIGFGTFDIKIGDLETCGQVVIRRLTPRLGDDMVVHARLTRCWEPPWTPPTFCIILLHARSGDGAAVSQAQLSIDKHPTRFRTDSYGRVVTTMDFGKTSSVTLTSEKKSLIGNAMIECTRSNPRIERTVTLRPR